VVCVCVCCGVVWCVALRCVALCCVALWCGVVWCGAVWCGVVWCGVAWCGVVRCGVVWCGVVWCGVVWCGVVWCGVVWCGVVWCGVVWCGVLYVFEGARLVRGCKVWAVRRALSGGWRTSGWLVAVAPASPRAGAAAGRWLPATWIACRTQTATAAAPLSAHCCCSATQPTRRNSPARPWRRAAAGP
jgi:hypothetical protein